MTKPSPPPRRITFVKRCLELIHTPYIYGGRSRDGVDCWGFIALAWEMAGGGETYFEWWTDVGWNKLEILRDMESPRPGDLAFYGGKGPSDVSHVMVCLWGNMLIGASGGDSKTRTFLEAAKRGAKVKVIEDGTAYNSARGDFRGFRILPFEGG
jgi:murein DD-endopeptidase